MGRCRHIGSVVPKHYCLNGCSPNTCCMNWNECSRCGAWLSLGPSNDSPEVVQIEMRAAEIAASRKVLACDDDVADQIDCERCGWEACLDAGSDGPNAPWHAGYLARCIATHEDE